MVFQNYALYPHMSVFDNMAFGLKLQKLPKAEIDERVARGGRGSSASTSCSARKPAALSGGQRQRVAMGRAIVRHPQAFLMDEPLSNLDAKLRVQMRSEIARIQHDLGVTTIYVTHDQTEAMTMGDRVAVIRKGELQQVDSPQTLYEHPVNLFVAGFIGSPAMNLFDATLVGDDGPGWRSSSAASACPCPTRSLAARPALRGYAGRTVVLGIRPEDMEDAVARVRCAAPTVASRPPSSCARRSGPTSSCTSRIDAPPAMTDDVKELAVDVGAGGARAGRAAGRGRPHDRARPPQPAHHGRARATDRAGRRHAPPALLRSRRRHRRSTHDSRRDTTTATRRHHMRVPTIADPAVRARARRRGVRRRRRRR